MDSSPSEWAADTELGRPAARGWPPLIVRHGLMDDVLGAHEHALGRDFAGYRGHVYRTFNFARALAGYPDDTRSLAIAACFHDIGIWTDFTFDYLEPSARRALAYVGARESFVNTVALRRIIDSHHKLTPCVGDPLAEAFRRADLVDLTWGWSRFGLARGWVAAVQAAFPNAGFHRSLCGVALRWARAHPLRPLPMVHW